MGPYIGFIVAVLAITSIFFRKNKSGGLGYGSIKANPSFFWIGLTAAIVGVIGYVFLGWRF